MSPLLGHPARGSARPPDPSGRAHAGWQELIDGILTAGAQHRRRLLECLDLPALGTVERALGFMLAAAEAERDDCQSGGNGASPDLAARPNPDHQDNPD